ncbi:hypothetical protein N6H18_00525 [Reichenbachiella agarivorans]|uniref:Adhesin n=1 Tax=Reichenbachiella agarivorans TaxID=2979464 RepID=A0ABY6CRJ1_9BACT|nr:hypothetical protein [Reichenbachiella agarivorans]UXP32459.1 hypothetical protein N6H18_00525 [Reichenbachiella agarivorans]
MKKLVYKYLITMLLIGCCVVDLSARGNIEKKKVVEKNYTVKDFTKLSIANSFGRVHVNTTDGNTVHVKVEVIARKNTEAKAMELLDQIQIQISQSAEEIGFVTEIDGKVNNRGSENFEVNYLVSMPKSNPLILKNSFGDSYVGDLNGRVDLKISYGNIKTERLNGNCDIKVSFGGGSFKRVASGSIEVKYSDVSFEQLGIVKFEQGYSDIEIGTAKTIDMTSKYGDMDIGRVEGIKGYMGYSDLVIGYLGVELDVESSYAGNFKIRQVSKQFQRVNLTGKFSNFKLGFEEGTNATFEVNVKYGDFDYSDSSIDLSYKNKSDNKADYKGKMGNGKGGTLSISSSYGNIDLE